jgi:hypothetical protein
MAGRDAVAGGSLAAGAHRERGIPPRSWCVLAAVCNGGVVGGDGWW